MDLANAFGKVNRKILWGKLYREGLPTQTIYRIKQGHQNTTLRYKDNGEDGPAIQNNIVAPQGSALSALLFIIYIDDMRHDYQATNAPQQLPKRNAIQTNPQIHYRQTLTRMEGAKTEQLKSQGTEKQPPKQHKPKISHEMEAPGNEIIFADGTNIIAEHDTPEKLVQKPLNYHQIALTRQLSIQ